MALSRFRRGDPKRYVSLRGYSEMTDPNKRLRSFRLSPSPKSSRIVGLLLILFLYTLTTSASPTYYYASSDMKEGYTECPLKCKSFESLIGSRQGVVRFNARNWFLMGQWRDYLSHPRWQLPYQPMPADFYEKHFAPKPAE